MFGSAPRGPFKGQSAGRPPLLDLPPNLRLMFEPLAPVEFKPPVVQREMPPYSGISSFVTFFEKDPPPKPKPFETPQERKQKLKEKMQQLHKEKIEILVNDWDPHSNAKATENAYLTLFVGRLSYETNEKKLRREFEQFGPIRSIRLVSDSEGKSRGYAFIEFENEADMTNAYRKSNGKKIDGKAIVCDVERGRTVRNWRPMRFGGGLGGRISRKKEETGPAGGGGGGAQRGGSSLPPSSQDDRRGGGGRERSRSRDNGGGGGRNRDSFRDSNRERERGGGGYRQRSRSRDRGGGGGYRRDAPPSSSSSLYAPPASSSGAPGLGYAQSRYPSSSSSYGGASQSQSGAGYQSRGGEGGGNNDRRGRSRSRDRR